MEAKLVLILTACLLLSFSNQGDAQPCPLSDLSVTQTAVLGKTGGYPQYRVTVENRCTCAQIDVKLACKGFNSFINVDPAGVITSDDDALCTLNGGQSVHHGETVTFTYSWSMKISFDPVGSTIECSEACAPALSAV